MRKIQNIFTLLTLMLTVACVGEKDPGAEYSVTISASQPNISVEDGESVQIRVKNHSVDVTEQAEIYYIAEGEEVLLDSDGVFVATESGEYSFGARYGGVEAEGHAVVRAYTADELTTEFYRRNVIMKFTGTWCVNCPKMGDAIIEVEHSMPNRIVEMAIHYSDVLSVDDGVSLYNNFGLISLPTAIVDFNGSTTTSSSSVLESLVSSSIESNPTASGIRLATSLSGTTLEVEAGVTASATANYKVALALVVDNYHYAQTGADDPNYKQNKVLRYYISDILGDSLGELTAGAAEMTKSYQVEVPSEALESESRVIAYVLNEVDGKFVINNATECEIGESIDYMYEIE